MSENRLIYLPLGGAGEIGMNAYVYGYGHADKERLIVADLGVTFPDMEGSPGVDLIMPDVSWLIERRDLIDAIHCSLSLSRFGCCDAKNKAQPPWPNGQGVGPRIRRLRV